jgi:hypothetical protein
MATDRGRLIAARPSRYWSGERTHLRRSARSWPMSGWSVEPGAVPFGAWVSSEPTGPSGWGCSLCWFRFWGRSCGQAPAALQNEAVIQAAARLRTARLLAIGAACLLAAVLVVALLGGQSVEAPS